MTDFAKIKDLKGYEIWCLRTELGKRYYKIYLGDEFIVTYIQKKHAISWIEIYGSIRCPT